MAAKPLNLSEIQIINPNISKSELDAMKSQIKVPGQDTQLPFQDAFNSTPERFHHIRQEKLYTDCQFKVGERIFDAHKLILAISSPVFEAMLYGSLAEFTKKPILITDIDSEIFELLFDYIYANRFNVDSVEKAKNLMYAAHKYLITALQKKCTEYIRNNLNSTNAFEAYEFALLFDETALLEQCLQHIKLNTSNVLSKCDFSKVSIDTLLTVVTQEQLNIQTELELFNAVEKFAENNGFHEGSKNVGTKSSRRSKWGSRDDMEINENYVKELKLHEAIRSIRFLTMTAAEFASGPASSQLLLPMERLAIISRLASPNCTKLFYPPDFCKITTRRGNVMMRRHL